MTQLPLKLLLLKWNVTPVSAFPSTSIPSSFTTSEDFDNCTPTKCQGQRRNLYWQSVCRWTSFKVPFLDFAFSVASGTKCLWSGFLGNRFWERDLYAESSLGSGLRNTTCEGREGSKSAQRKTRYNVITAKGLPNLRGDIWNKWPFGVVTNGGKGAKSLHPCFKQSLDVGHSRRRYKLGEDHFPGPWAMSREELRTMTYRQPSLLAAEGIHNLILTREQGSTPQHPPQCGLGWLLGFLIDSLAKAQPPFFSFSLWAYFSEYLLYKCFYNGSMRFRP